MPPLIYITTAPNDADLVPGLGPEMAVSVPVPTDVLFSGLWDHDVLINIAIERKKLGDLIHSIEDGRLLKQLGTLRDMGFRHIWMLFEGEARPNPKTGQLQHRRKGYPELSETEHYRWRDYAIGRRGEHSLYNFDYARFELFLLGLEAHAGIHVTRTTSPEETYTRIYNIWKLYQKAPSDHSSLQRMYVPTVPVALVGQHPVLRRVVKEFPGISWERSGWIMDEFETLEKFLGLDPVNYVLISQHLKELDGIGPVTADKFIKSLRGESV